MEREEYTFKTNLYALRGFNTNHTVVTSLGPSSSPRVIKFEDFYRELANKANNATNTHSPKGLASVVPHTQTHSASFGLAATSVRGVDRRQRQKQNERRSDTLLICGHSGSESGPALKSLLF
ncbi:hypothetical protein MRX96_017545 [Rhipicephalus microplus]